MLWKDELVHELGERERQCQADRYMQAMRQSVKEARRIDHIEETVAAELHKQVAAKAREQRRLEKEEIERQKRETCQNLLTPFLHLSFWL